MSHRGKTYRRDKSLVNSAGVQPTRSENLNALADLRAAANLVKDLRSATVPLAVARSEAKRVKALGLALAHGRITIDEMRAELRGAA